MRTVLFVSEDASTLCTLRRRYMRHVRFVPALGALDFLDRLYGEAIDLVVLVDEAVAGWTGNDLLEALVRVRPQLGARVIFAESERLAPLDRALIGETCVAA
jgi:hypothetical protein